MRALHSAVTPASAFAATPLSFFDAARRKRRGDRFLVAIVVAIVLVAIAFSALSSVYSGVNARSDFPEPWTQMTD